jgi:hypothetical protein
LLTLVTAGYSEKPDLPSRRPSSGERVEYTLHSL